MRLSGLLLDQGAADHALVLLLDGPPRSFAEAPQLHALRAALHQRLGQYQSAAQEYEGLLATEPDNGIWLMGLGIAREHGGAVEQATSAYRAALTGRGLSPALIRFVRQRLAALQGE